MKDKNARFHSAFEILEDRCVPAGVVAGVSDGVDHQESTAQCSTVDAPTQQNEASNTLSNGNQENCPDDTQGNNKSSTNQNNNDGGQSSSSKNSESGEHQSNQAKQSDSKSSDRSHSSRDDDFANDDFFNEYDSFGDDYFSQEYDFYGDDAQGKGRQDDLYDFSHSFSNDEGLQGRSVRQASASEGDFDFLNPNAQNIDFSPNKPQVSMEEMLANMGVQAHSMLDAEQAMVADALMAESTFDGGGKVENSSNLIVESSSDDLAPNVAPISTSVVESSNLFTTPIVNFVTTNPVDAVVKAYSADASPVVVFDANQLAQFFSDISALKTTVQEVSRGMGASVQPLVELFAGDGIAMNFMSGLTTQHLAQTNPAITQSVLSLLGLQGESTGTVTLPSLFHAETLMTSWGNIVSLVSVTGVVSGIVFYRMSRNTNNKTQVAWLSDDPAWIDGGDSHLKPLPARVVS